MTFKDLILTLVFSGIGIVILILFWLAWQEIGESPEKTAEND